MIESVCEFRVRSPPVGGARSVLWRIDGRTQGVHHLWPRGRFLSSARTRGVAAMVKNLVAGCVIAALIVMGLLAFAQKHEECWHGRLLKTFKPCGSISSSL